MPSRAGRFANMRPTLGDAPPLKSTPAPTRETRRLSVNLDPTRHMALRLWSTRAAVPATEIVVALIDEAETDDQLRDRLTARARRNLEAGR